MIGPGRYYAKWHKSERDQLICDPKSKTNDRTKRTRKIDTKSKLVVTRVEEEGIVEKGKVAKRYNLAFNIK